MSPDSNRTSVGEEIIVAFAGQVATVESLLDFDNLVLEHAVGGLASIADGLEQANRHNAATSVRNRLDAIKNIRHSSSLRPRYETIFNQCVVLLVSYFGSSIGDLFRFVSAKALQDGIDVPLAGRDVSLTWLKLGRGSTAELVADAVVEQDKITFQDMQSVTRAFRDNLNLSLDRDSVMNDIILGQAARHVIVHAGGRVGPKMIHQLREASPRQLKPAMCEGEIAQFDPAEVRLLGASMLSFLRRVSHTADGLFSSGDSRA